MWNHFQNSNGVPTDGKKHYFAVYFMNALEGKTVKEMWHKTAKHEGICRINAIFEKVGTDNQPIPPKPADDAGKEKPA
ncbi:hypothetical protein ANCDUO_01608 [Ancylostoma duodenale]|uniref:Uncharacterized protein n=1 Tax=Ancylostoma duodenale TaxID=51022 RepID=A0A0C2H2P8_9BILA|nr:hypothetical protein ANCDUO_01608 [Ancylostoma duodenale]